MNKVGDKGAVLDFQAPKEELNPLATLFPNPENLKPEDFNLKDRVIRHIEAGESELAIRIMNCLPHFLQVCGKEILMRAVLSEQLSVITNCVENGMDVNDDNYLENAIFQRKFESMKRLVEHGANVKRNSALHELIRNCTSVDQVELLLDQGADVRAPFEGHSLWPNKGERYPLDFVCAAHPLDLMAGWERERNEKAGITKAEIVQAAEKVRFSVAKLLLERGADASEVTDRKDAIPFLWNFLTIKLGRDCTSRDVRLEGVKFGLQNSKLEEANYLLEKGFDPNCVCKGDTLLHLVTDDTSEALVRLLLRAGADPTLKNSEGQTPYDKLEAAGQTKHLRLLSPKKHLKSE